MSLKIEESSNDKMEEKLKQAGLGGSEGYMCLLGPRADVAREFCGEAEANHMPTGSASSGVVVGGTTTPQKAGNLEP